MSPLIEMPKPKLEVADILRQHIAEYRNEYPLEPDQHRIVSHLLHCRTPTLGGHMERCTHCGGRAHPLSFLPQPTLPQVPANTPRAMA
jgi:hypothetical protein